MTKIPDDALRILAHIQRHEAPKGYDQVYGGSRLQPPKPLTQMTVDEVLAWQDASVARGSKSSAAGGFQIIRKTLRQLKSDMELSGREIFTADLQSAMAYRLLEGRGYSKWKSGAISTERFANNVAHEWASMPLVSGPNRGRSAYAGDGLNSALTNVDAYLATFDPNIPGPSLIRQEETRPFPRPAGGSTPTPPAKGTTWLSRILRFLTGAR